MEKLEERIKENIKLMKKAGHTAPDIEEYIKDRYPEEHRRIAEQYLKEEQ